MNFFKKITQDPDLFCETRYKLIPSLPLQLGSISLGYSNNSIHVYFSSAVGQHGFIDWDLQTFLQKWRNAIYARNFTPDIISLFQDITNQFLPGFEYDINNFHWFIRPHIQTAGTQVGFALFGSTSFSILGNDPQSLSNLHFFTENLSTLLPLTSFAFRRYSIPNLVGQIVCDLFVSVGSSQTIYLEIIIKFLFQPSKISKHMFESISKVNDGNQNNTEYKMDDEHFAIVDDGCMVENDIKEEEEVHHIVNGVSTGNATQVKCESVMKYVPSLVDCNSMVNDMKDSLKESIMKSFVADDKCLNNLYGNETYWKLLTMIGFVMGSFSMGTHFKVSKEMVNYVGKIKARM